VLAQFLAACETGTLPAVSWIVAPYAYSEHPSARPIDGAAYTQTVLNAIWAQPDLWRNTVVLLNYDEHDGFFDHVIAPTAPAGTPDEFVDHRPVGLGPRVPMTVVSPWSRGGWINSQVFDHTSVLRFLELWTGVREPNISAWRRRICGDLTTCLDFSHADLSVPTLPDTAALRRQADRRESKLPEPTPPPPGEQVFPTQEPGTAPARALPYQAWANASWHGGVLSVALGNDGEDALQLQVYDLLTRAPAHRVDVAAHQDRSATVAAPAEYRVAVHGPNRFLRYFAGDTRNRGIEISTTISGTPTDPRATITAHNSTLHDVTAEITGIASTTQAKLLTPGTHPIVENWKGAQRGWYDVIVRLRDDATYTRRFTGHLESGRGSVTGPQNNVARR
jgi:phospholipase C